MLEFLTKINIVLNSIKLIREYKAVRFAVLCSTIAGVVFFYGFSQYRDNSIYKDNKEDSQIRESIKGLLAKCGDKHALGLSTISTESKTSFYAKFKEIMSCDFRLNPQNCIVDLSADKFPFAGDYLVDSQTYAFLQKLSVQEDVEKIYLPEFELSDLPTIEGLILKSEHFQSGEMKYLFLTAIQNAERNLIYAVSLTAWGDKHCENAKYLLSKFKNSLPTKK